MHGFPSACIRSSTLCGHGSPHFSRRAVASAFFCCQSQANNPVDPAGMASVALEGGKPRPLRISIFEELLMSKRLISALTLAALSCSLLAVAQQPPAGQKFTVASSIVGRGFKNTQRNLTRSEEHTSELQSR